MTVLLGSSKAIALLSASSAVPAGSNFKFSVSQNFLTLMFSFVLLHEQVATAT
jgi:hypothetical protein